MDRQEDGLLAKRGYLKASIRKLGRQIAALKAKVVEMEVQKKRAGEGRGGEGAGVPGGRAGPVGRPEGRQGGFENPRA
eukprot:10045928-Lingulodinium_polyedra.AAC.1